jgi:5-methylcytosine-specific restriction protein A
MVIMMPSKPLRPCKHLGCHNLSRDTYCPDHKQDKHGYDKQRGTASQRGYNARWRKARTYYLSKNPFCIRCKDKGLYTLATVIDHIIPHRGDYDLFWNRDNWQPLCKQCHDRKTATEDGGFGN